MRHRRITLALLLMTPAIASAQDAPPPPIDQQTILQVNVRDVDINALVRDPSGKLLVDLTRDDFQITEDGKPYPIRYFNNDHDLPLALGLMVDTSASQLANIPDEIRSSEVFLSSMLTRPVDTAFLVRFDTEVTLLSPATSDVSKLRTALNLLTHPHAPRPMEPGKTRRPGTLLYDAIAATSQQVAARAPGRRALIILTDGMDNGSNIWLAVAIAQAQRANTAVYVILYSSPEADSIKQRRAKLQANMAMRHPGVILPFPIDVPTEAMQTLAHDTGGRVFPVKKGQSIENIYSEISTELRSQYRIGYVPPPSASGVYHVIRLIPRDPSLVVQTRTRYITP
jgi:VWFA-related protein